MISAKEALKESMNNVFKTDNFIPKSIIEYTIIDCCNSGGFEVKFSHSILDMYFDLVFNLKSLGYKTRFCKENGEDMLVVSWGKANTQYLPPQESINYMDHDIQISKNSSLVIDEHTASKNDPLYRICKIGSNVGPMFYGQKKVNKGGGLFCYKNIWINNKQFCDSQKEVENGLDKLITHIDYNLSKQEFIPYENKNGSK